MTVDGWVRARPVLADTVLAGVLAAVLLPLSVVIVTASPGPWSPVLIAATGVAHAAIAVRRSLPFVSFALVSVGIAAQTLVPGSALPPEALFLPSAVLFPLSLGSYCGYGRWPARPLALAVGVAGAVMLTVRCALVSAMRVPGLPDPAAWVFFLGFLLAVVFAPWSYSALRDTRLAYVAALEDRAARAEAEREERARRAVLDERTRIARDMHDVVAHSLAVIVTQAQGGQFAPERAPAVLETIAETGRQALADMRGLLGVLRTDDSLDGFGPQPVLGDVDELLQRVRAAGLDVELVEVGARGPLPPTAELAGFRLIQEALTNTMKHAGGGARATVRLTWDSEALAVDVTDNGTPKAPAAEGGHGLLGMRERISVVGGTLSAGPATGGGFRVRAVLPYRQGAAA
ncbi:histidine kinase [Longispora sp. K20-0274]|uniref:sensor histidine kinase n=1 Tax=Longispora sp. K20-0274 TaxID=3088255 RepID=UPI00399B96C7